MTRKTSSHRFIDTLAIIGIIISTMIVAMLLLNCLPYIAYFLDKYLVWIVVLVAIISPLVLTAIIILAIHFTRKSIKKYNSNANTHKTYNSNNINDLYTYEWVPELNIWARVK